MPLALAALALSPACGGRSTGPGAVGPSPRPLPTPTQEPRLILTPPAFTGVTPRPIGGAAPIVVEGREDAYSTLFASAGAPWRIQWSIRADASGDFLFVVAVLQPDRPGQPVTAFEAASNQRSGAFEVRAPAGEYYLRVYTANVERWRLEIAQ
ncbi:MAG: hypothetical protein HYX97_06070 [Chloroflexi bacterium]|nr:hypothetical protein [Chloroflexota bacterium]